MKTQRTFLGFLLPKAKSCSRAVGKAVFFMRVYWHDRQVDDDNNGHGRVL